jgi:peroxiredoxin
MITPGSKAPGFSLDSHKGEKISSADLVGKKNQLLVFYPLDFTPT